jgi:glucokinase
VAKKKDIFVGVDLGGTSLRALVVDNRNNIKAIEKIPTRPNTPPARLIRDIAGSIRKAVIEAGTDWTRVAAVSVGAPGAVDPENGMVYKAPNLGWIDVPLGPRHGGRTRAGRRQG